MFQAPDTDQGPPTAGGFKAPDTDANPSPQWSDIPGNMAKGIEEAPSELANMGKGLLNAVPDNAKKLLELGGPQMALGQPPIAAIGAIAGPPIAQGLINTAKDWGAGQLMHGDLSGAAQQAKNNIIEHPIKSALDVASVAAPFMTPEASTIESGLDEAATRASRLAQEQSIKSLEGAIGQVRQVGPEEARALGQMALDKGIVSPFTPSTLGMERTLNTELGKAGEAIGAGRAAGDIAGGAPEASLLKNNIEAQLTPKYESGMRAGEMGSLQNALNEVGKIGETPSFVKNAEKATEMNQFATGNKMLQPTGSFTDVANSLSAENNAALQKALTPEQWDAYQSALNDYSGLSDIQKFFTRGESRELAGRGSGLLTDVYKGVKDVVGHKALAAGADTFSKMLSSPAIAKALPALVTAAKTGPAALETTHYLMQKNDPDYNDATKDIHGGNGGPPPPISTDSILANVMANPALKPWAQAFQQAAQRGPQAVTVAHFTAMQKDPEYNEAYTKAMEPQ